MDESPLEVGDADLSVTVTSLDGDLAVVAVSGEVDLATAPTLQHPLITLADNGHRRLVLDLSGVGFLDSSGLAALVRVLRRVRDQGGWLRLAAVRPAVLRLLEVSGLLDALPVYETVAAARVA